MTAATHTIGQDHRRAGDAGSRAVTMARCARAASAALVAALGVATLGVATLGGVPSAGAAETAPVRPTASSWIDTVNWYRSMAHLAPVAEEPVWSNGLTSHLEYLAQTPAALKTGAYASAHTENPASPAYTAEGAAAGAAADLYLGAVPSDEAVVDAWMTAPFHAIGILRTGLQRAGFASTAGGAGLDVIRGLATTASTGPVVWPGDGSTVALSRAGSEQPDPLASCGFGSTAGLPLLALLPSDPAPGTTATLRGPDGRTLTQGPELCVLTQSTFHSNDAVYGPAGQAILKGDHAVVIIPKAPLTPGTYGVTLTVPGQAGVSWSFTENPDARPPTPPAAVPGQYNPVVPQRLLDTRNGTGAPVGKVAPGHAVRLVIAGRAVPAGTQAVVLNVTATEPDAAGFVSVVPCQTAPTTSSLNYEAGQTVANSSVVALDDAGAVCLSSMSPVHLVVDLNGFFPPDAGFHGTTPTRLLDTRSGTGAPAGQPAPRGVVELHVVGRPELAVPASARAVVLNVTATNPRGSGFVTVWPCGQPMPTSSNLNVGGATTVANLVVVPLGAGGTVCLATMNPLDLVADVAGWFAGDASFQGSNPTRLLDTRTTTGGVVQPGVVVQVATAGVAPAGATAVVLNVTAADPQRGGYVTAWPCDAPQPTASNLNVAAGETRPNLVVAKVAADGRVCLVASMATDLVVDFEGSFTSR